VDFVEICNVCTRKVIIKAAKRIFNSDKICCSYYDFYFGVTFLEHTVDMLMSSKSVLLLFATSCAIILYVPVFRGFFFKRKLTKCSSSAKIVRVELCALTQAC